METLLQFGCFKCNWIYTCKRTITWRLFSSWDFFLYKIWFFYVDALKYNLFLECLKRQKDWLSDLRTKTNQPKKWWQKIPWQIKKQNKFDIPQRKNIKNDQVFIKYLLLRINYKVKYGQKETKIISNYISETSIYYYSVYCLGANIHERWNAWTCLRKSVLYKIAFFGASLICIFTLGLKSCLFFLFSFFFFRSIIDVRTTRSAVLSQENWRKYSYVLSLSLNDIWG